jgi:hypothetical protein
MKLSVKKISQIIDFKTFVISGLSVVSTAICIHFKFEAEFPLTMITTSIVFPIVFSIGGAYKRREAALKEYAAIKGYLRSIYYVSRDWLPSPKAENIVKINQLIFSFFNNFRTMFSEPIDKLQENETKIHENFSYFSLYIKNELRNEGLSSGECSRTNQYLQKMIVSCESIKHIYQYRTPRTLRYFSSLFIVILPIVYGPYFAFMSESMSWGLEYVVPVLLTMILVSLENIQEHLENPFDQVGEDDIKFNVEKFMGSLIETPSNK